jgi:ribosomal protein S18 acetylase RimI-like enzyme
MPDRLRFRHVLDLSDIARIRALVKATGVFSAEEIKMAGELGETTLDGTETYRWLLAERGSELAGYTCFDRVYFTKGAFDLFWIAVLPTERGSGLATDLMRRTAKFIRGKRGTDIYAETSSREPYAPARAFYAKSGFVEAARLDDFYGPGDDKVIYRMKL